MRKKFFDTFLALCLTLVLIASALPASAAEKVVYAKSLDGKTEYTSIGDAWKVVKKGGTIVMQCDWKLSERLVLDDEEAGTVYMNGYKIDRSLTSSKRDGEVIYLDEYSSLTLKGCDADGENITDKKFDVSGKDLSGETSGKLMGGGLITGGYSSNGAGGIHMKEHAELTLDNVIVAGNKVKNDYGGGVNMNNVGDSLTLKNGAAIAYNVAKLGGGVYVATHNCKISLSDGSTIAYNYATESGGGIYSYGSYTTIELTESSAISNNIAGEDGGGFYGYYSCNTIESSDKTGSMSNNVAKDCGGAIFLGSVILLEDKNSISGICFDGNTCSSRGGAIYLNQEWSTIQDCIIKNNSATGSSGVGGGVYNINDKNTFTNCTITGNYANGYGGGIYQGLYNNIQLRGKVIIKNNTSEDGTLDDLYLADAWLSTAYIVSQPAAGSEIGIMIYADGSARKIGEDTQFDETVFFSDLKGYYIRYDSNEKEMYLTPNSNASYSVTVNGKLQGYYNASAKVTIDGTPTDSSKAFKQWTGDVDALDSAAKEVASVSMKSKKDLSFTSEYVTKVSDFTLTVAKPVAGSDLPTSGTLSWTGDDKASKSLSVPVYWLVQNGETTQTASGTADYNTNYSVAAMIDADVSNDLAFADTVNGTVKYTDTDGEKQTYKVYVDDTHSKLYMYGEQIQTEKAVIDHVEDATINIKKDSSEAELKALLPKTAVIYDEDGNEYIVNTDVDSADLKAVVTDGMVNENGGSAVIPLKLDGTEKVENGTGDAEKKLRVTVKVTTDGTLAVPTASVVSGTYKDKGEDGNVTLNIKLAAEAGASIYYKVNDAADFAAYDSEAGITISAAEGTKKSFNVKIYAGGKPGYADSSVAAYTYILDNPYTVTITKKSTALQDGIEIGEKYAAQYYQGDTVVIGAPVVDGCVFDRWQAEDGMTIDDSNAKSSPLTVENIQNNIRLTALYNPIVKSMDIEIAAPAVGESLTDTAVVSAVIKDGTSYDLTKYIDSIVWSPAPKDGKAAYETAYEAVITFKKDTDVKFAATELESLTVNGGAADAAVTVSEEEGCYAAHILFPTTAADPDKAKDSEDEKDSGGSSGTKPDTSKDSKDETDSSGDSSSTKPDTEKPTEPDTENTTEPAKPDDYKYCEKDDKCPIAKFHDAKPQLWYHDGVQYCLDNGLMNGVSDDEFAPDTNMTRAQLVTILWRMNGKKTVNYTMTMKDIAAGTWYTEAVRWAASEGIVKGYSNDKFAPGDAVTREQIAAILCRYAAYEGMDVSTEKDTGLTQYADASKVSFYAVSAVKWAVSEHIMNGIDAATLSPLSTATRAQVAAMIQRFCGIDR